MSILYGSKICGLRCGYYDNTNQDVFHLIFEIQSESIEEIKNMYNNIDKSKLDIYSFYIYRAYTQFNLEEKQDNIIDNIWVKIDNDSVDKMFGNSNV